MKAQIHWEDIQVGDVVVTAEHTADERQLFLFSAATHNAHRIHYDLPYAQSEGYPALLVHGPLQRALMARFIAEWAGAQGRLLRLTLRHQGSASVGESLRFHARVSGKRATDEGGIVDLEIGALNWQDTLLMPGSATVRLPCRHPV